MDIVLFNFPERAFDFRIVMVDLWNELEESSSSLMGKYK
jgi:hypothetical protein